MKTLKENAMLVSLHISAWTGQVADIQATNEVEKNHNAHKAGAFIKALVDPASLKSYQKAATDLRSFFYKNTLPWDDSGRRILKVGEFFNFQNGFLEKKKAFEDAVEEFLNGYEGQVEDSKGRLGSLYIPGEYLSIDELRGKFGAKFSVGEITSDEDLRVQVHADQLEEFREIVRNDLNTSIDTANSEILNRVKDVIGKLIGRLKDKNTSFKASLISNISDLVNLMPKLNFTNNPEIDKMCVEMKGLLVDPSVLKKNDAVREEVVNKAENILSKYLN